MLTITMALGLTALLSFPMTIPPAAARHKNAGQAAKPQAAEPGARQLLAVRGEIIRIKGQSKGTVLITVRPGSDFAEVTVLARENDLVGAAVGRDSESDLFGLLTGDAREDETITAAELNEGDVVSIIYDPRLQNRVVEMYLH
ncbi:MAG TPA: hypothetical protein VJH03_27205 [Blastocatellia bacterium]|nr:hypothetical protein [Blastocatellia bacterium]